MAILTSSDISTFLNSGGTTQTTAQAAMMTLLQPLAEQAVKDMLGYQVEQPASPYVEWYPQTGPDQFETDPLVGGYELWGNRIFPQTYGARDRAKMILRELPVRTIVEIRENMGAQYGQGFPDDSILDTVDYFLDAIGPGAVQITTYTIGGTPAAGQVYSLVATDGVSIGYTANSSDTNTTIAEALCELLGLSGQIEFVVATWNATGVTITATGNTAGQTFAFSASTTGSGTIAVSTIQSAGSISWTGEVFRNSGAWSVERRSIQVTYVAGLTQSELSTGRYSYFKIATWMTLLELYNKFIINSKIQKTGGVPMSVTIEKAAVTFMDQYRMSTALMSSAIPAGAAKLLRKRMTMDQFI